MRQRTAQNLTQLRNYKSTIISRTHISPQIITSLHLSQVITKLRVLSSTQIFKQLLVFPGVKAAGM
jgi:hypothetical protein